MADGRLAQFSSAPYPDASGRDISARSSGSAAFGIGTPVLSKRLRKFFFR